jgi:hypothetical protein
VGAEQVGPCLPFRAVGTRTVQGDTGCLIASSDGSSGPNPGSLDGSILLTPVLDGSFDRPEDPKWEHTDLIRIRGRIGEAVPYTAFFFFF